jgi:hypothetical protein
MSMGDSLPERVELHFLADDILADDIATQGLSTNLAQRRRNCNVAVSLHLPNGHRSGVASALQTGYSGLPAGIGDTQRTEYDFPFYSNTILLETVIERPYKNFSERRDDLGIASMVRLPCRLHMPLNLGTLVYLQADSGLPATMALEHLPPN